MKFITGLVLAVIASQVFAQRLPVWELGAGVGMAQIPYYRGSNSERRLVLPLPLAVYRGEKVSVDREGAHRWLYWSDRMAVDISLAAGLPVPSNGDVKIRDGMPSLDSLVEIGPVVEIKLWQLPRGALSIHFPLRAATSVDWLSLRYQGIQFTPFFLYALGSYERNQWEFNLAIGPQFASRDYHAYYYSVSPEQATNTRPAYAPAAGYSGSRVTLYANKRLGRLWFSVFARYDHLAGAVFADSPLLERRNYFIGGLVLGWVFLESPRKVYIKQRDTF